MRRPLACALLLALPCLFEVRPAQANVVHDPIKLRVTSVTLPSSPGGSAQMDLEVLSAGEAEIAGLEIVGAAGTITLDGTKTGFTRMRAGEKAGLRIETAPGDTARIVTLRYRVGSEVRERTFDLRALADRIAHPRGGVCAVPGGRPPMAAPPAPEGGVPRTTRKGSSPGVAMRAVRVHGRFVCTRPDGSTVGGDGVNLRLMDHVSFPFADETLATGVVQIDGSYEFNLSIPDDESIDPYVVFTTANTIVQVQDSDLEFDYSWETPTYWGFPWGGMITDLDLGDLQPLAISERAAVYICASITRAWRWESSVGYGAPIIDVQWPAGSGTSYYVDFFQEIHLTRQSTWNEGTLFHEYGHHWMENFADYLLIDYCNGVCDAGGDCGHCNWCPENIDNTWTEGVPEWISSVTGRMVQLLHPADILLNRRGYESVQPCTPGGLGEPNTTEGFLAAAMEDLEDGTNEHDPSAAPFVRDRLGGSAVAVFQTLAGMSASSPYTFFTRYRDLHGGNGELVWETAKNSTFEIDYDGPGAVTFLNCTTHEIGVPANAPEFRLYWARASDAWSGVAGYSIALSTTSTLPDAVQDIGNDIFWRSAPMPPGTYWFCIRAVDRAGNWSDEFASLGPLIVRPPGEENLLGYRPFGWGGENLPRATNDATNVWAPAPTTMLPGEVAGTYWVHAVQNNGESPVTSAFMNRLYLDGLALAEQIIGPPLGPSNFVIVMESGPYTIRGGRHTWVCRTDDDDAVAEVVELDNRFGKQWVWSPAVLGAGVSVHRPAPPRKDAWLGAPFPLYFNSDGLRFGLAGEDYWGLVWTAADSEDDDYDCRIHYATDDPDTGFAIQRGFSARPAGSLDAVLANRNVVGDLSWDVGVVNSSAGSGDYRARFVVGTALEFDTSEAIDLPDGEYACVREVYVPPEGLGPVSLTLRHDRDAGPLHAAWFGHTFAKGSLDDADATVVTNALGEARLDLTLTEAGYYAFVVWRDPYEIPTPAPGLAAVATSASGAAPSDGRALVLSPPPVSMTVTVGTTPPDLIPYIPTAWFSPLVPLPGPYGTAFSVPMPDTLVGEKTSTYFNLAAKNASPTPAGVVPGEISLDGVPTWSFGFGQFAPGGSNLFNWSVPWIVSGGRHTLGVHYDAGGNIPELDDDNNAFADQFVWSPSVLGFEAPVARPTPPDPIGGWSLVPEGDSLRYNCDGLRSPLFLPNGQDGWWGAVVATPLGGADVDLRIHPRSTGARKGFDSYLESSGWAGPHPDFVLLDFNGLATGAYDIGVVRHGPAATGGYEAEAVQSTFFGTGGGVGQFALGAQHALRLHELLLAQGRYTITLHPTSSAARLGVGLYGQDGVTFAKDDVVSGTFEVAGSPAGDAIATALVNTAGYYALAVWKEYAGELAADAGYTLTVEADVTDVAPGGRPARTTLSLARPNPFRQATALSFALATEGDVSLEVYDLRGVRVRSLLEGRRAPGTYAVNWDGLDDASRAVPQGLYFVRLRAAGERAVLKLARIR